MSGVVIFSDVRKAVTGQNNIDYNLSGLSSGVYVAVFTDGENGRIVRKIVRR